MLKELIEKAQKRALEEGRDASEILACLLFEEAYQPSRFSRSELHAIIQELASCYLSKDEDLIKLLKEYHEEIFEDEGE